MKFDLVSNFVYINMFYQAVVGLGAGNVTQQGERWPGKLSLLLTETLLYMLRTHVTPWSRHRLNTPRVGLFGFSSPPDLQGWSGGFCVPKRTVLTD